MPSSVGSSARRKGRRALTVSVIAASAISLALPSFASSRDDVIDNEKDGWASASWSDNAGGTGTHVTAYWCTREFRARIRKHRSGLPDATHGSEWLNCLDYDDAVYSDGDTPTGTYHYDINGMDGSCFCNYRTTAGVTVYW